jgi:tetratricopeptide (TPR) repeat protein
MLRTDRGAASEIVTMRNLNFLASHAWFRRAQRMLLHVITLSLLASMPLAARAEAQNNLLEDARRLFHAGSYERASQVLQTDLKAHPQDADAHLLLGQIFALQGRRSEAIKELTRTIEIEPNSAEAYNMLGTVLNRFAELDAARKAFEQAVALDPKMTEAHINLAMALAESGDLHGAAAQLRAAIALQPDAPAAARAHYLLAKIDEDQQPARAMDELAMAARIDPKDEQIWLELGNLKSEAGDEASALAAFRNAAVLNPRDAEAQYQLGSEYLITGDGHEAVVHLELARKAMPKPTVALLYKLDRALRKVGDNQQAQHVRAEAQALLAQDSEANEHFQQAESLAHEGLVLDQQGDTEKALEKYRAALEINPQQNHYRYNYALALCHAGRWQQGIAELNEVLENDPGNIDARRALFIAKDKARQAAAQQN